MKARILPMMPAAVAAALVASGCGKTQVASLPPPEVSVSQPVEREVTEYLDFTGRTEAVASVEVRARVTGYITRVNFAAGARVNQGGVLFEIDPREYAAEVTRGEGEVARLQAVLAKATSEVGRTQRLRPTGAASEREVESAIASLGSAEGELKTAIATLEKAKLDLEFTKVTAPIAGRVSRAEITEGNLVVADSSGGQLLTTIVSVDPMYVYFDADERSLLRYREAALRDVGYVSPETVQERKIPVLIGLANEEGHPHAAVLDFVDNRVDPSTGTIRVRAVLSNENGFFTPGLFVRVRLPFGEPRRGVLVTERAVGADQDRKYVLVVSDKNVVEYRQVKLGPVVEGLRVVSEGLAPSDWVIVNGIQRARPGITVAPQRTSMIPAPKAS
jgi:RND family efflux transporter MFP subunit